MCLFASLFGVRRQFAFGLVGDGGAFLTQREGMDYPGSSSADPLISRKNRDFAGAKLRFFSAGGALCAEVGEGEGFVQQQDGVFGRGELQHHGGLLFSGTQW